MVRIYFDNDIASAISRRDLSDPEMHALDQVLEWGRSGKATLGTSRQSAREMERAPAPYPWPLKQGLTELEIAPNDHRVLGFSTLSDQYGGFIANPLVTDIVDDELYVKLMAVGLKKDDAHHFMYAVRNGFEWFVTMDRNFLNQVTVLAKLCSSLRVARPSGVVAELSSL